MPLGGAPSTSVAAPGARLDLGGETGLGFQALTFLLVGATWLAGATEAYEFHAGAAYVDVLVHLAHRRELRLTLAVRARAAVDGGSAKGIEILGDPSRLDAN